jgi:hypothetical protein
MTLDRLSARASAIASRAADEARDRILSAATVPPGVIAERIDGAIALSGKRLRSRMIADPNLRNFGR